MKTIIEPFKIKSVEPLRFTSRDEREAFLETAFLNPFLLHADDVLIDLLTDSGTTAMSALQWSGMMNGDEAYAGSRSYYRFERTLKELTGFTYVIPTHQGRAAEKILFSIVGGQGKVIPNNTHFDTTRANIEYSGATAVDLLTDVGKRPDVVADFKGNMDVDALVRLIDDVGVDNIPLVMMTVTNNSGGGQPVSMANMKAVRAVCTMYGIPFFIDACRFAENAMFIKMREPGYADRSVRSIVQEMFALADGATMSAKKDGMVNTGGFLAMHDSVLAEKARTVLIVTEGFPTYGGLARRDLEAMAQGLDEVLDEAYLTYRLRSVEYFGDHLRAHGVPILEPTGGHAVYLDASRFAPHIAPSQFPGQAIACALYVEGGIRGVEIGSLMFGTTDAHGIHVAPPMELVRLAIPRRVYTQSHIDYCIEIIVDVYKNRDALRGMKLTYEAPFLRHFTARLAYAE
ncbi:MAG: tryptophanase [Candidatus Kapabacteria bacterium]|nr:tryptophanase [Candidatus Kapabacteria bacterium]